MLGYDIRAAPLNTFEVKDIDWRDSELRVWELVQIGTDEIRLDDGADTEYSVWHFMDGQIIFNLQ